MLLNSNVKRLFNLAKQFQRCSVSTASDKLQPQTQENAPAEGKNMSQAMKAYLERAKTYNEFIEGEVKQYNIGKRHLANMMGRDPETFTQKEIDEAIEYLFPSGLFEPKARPFLKPPHLVFPPKKDAEFDTSGRPYHFLFYTGKPNFYSIMHEVVKHINSLTKEQDLILKGKQNSFYGKCDISGSKWLSKQELENLTVEIIHDIEYNNLIYALDRLIEFGETAKCKDFIMKLRVPLMEATMTFVPPEPKFESDGKAYVTTKDCPRKSARAEVTVIYPGTGNISINGKGIEYFSTIQARNQILFPLELSGLRTSVDIKASVQSGGESGQAGAVRWGISWGLRPFVTKDVLETMRLAGLLTRDFRRRERKKPGQARARKKFTWKKR
ncbi:28S ribosomal protein S9, mitochondrial-like isoform X2 [Cimex lectularius]|uniref:Small ribosomal subunit protein uS9m n=1 Tax=Cimex lectularius TaxID=79782 RepID=A0A8I6RB14_CIMLE|nr:28S ribosomal protein S9, mitochondrial-like isoform X2 [Cimex lectularius]